MTTTGWTELTTETELRALLGTPSGGAVRKERDHLHDLDLAWIAASPFLLMATSAADGTCDVSPKGDPAGFVHVLDDRTLVVPERPGNRRADGWVNVLSNPHVGLIFLVPGRIDTLRVNGRARLVSDAPFFDDLVVKGHRPILALVVDIEEIFFHCAKAFLRSGLWKPETWDPEAHVPRRALIAKEVEPSGMTIEQLDDYYDPANYSKRLYG